MDQDSSSLLPSQEVLMENRLRLAKYEVDFHKSCSAVKSFGSEIRDAKAYLLKEILSIAGFVEQDMRDYTSEIEEAHNKLNTELQAVKLEKAVLKSAHQEVCKELNAVTVDRDTLLVNCKTLQSANETLQSVNGELLKALQDIRNGHKESQDVLVHRIDSLQRENSQLSANVTKLKADSERLAENLTTGRQDSPNTVMETVERTSHRVEIGSKQAPAKKSGKSKSTTNLQDPHQTIAMGVKKAGSQTSGSTELSVNKKKRKPVGNAGKGSSRQDGRKGTKSVQKQCMPSVEPLVTDQTITAKDDEAGIETSSSGKEKKRKKADSKKRRASVSSQETDYSESESNAPPKKKPKTKPSVLDTLHTDQTKGSAKPVRKIGHGRPKILKSKQIVPHNLGNQATTRGTTEADNQTTEPEGPKSHDQTISTGTKVSSNQTSKKRHTPKKKEGNGTVADSTVPVKRKRGRPKKIKSPMPKMTGSSEMTNGASQQQPSEPVEINSEQPVPLGTEAGLPPPSEIREQDPGQTSQPVQQSSSAQIVSEERVESTKSASQEQPQPIDNGSNTQASLANEADIHDHGIAVSTRTRGRLSFSGATVDTALELPKYTRKRKRKQNLLTFTTNKKASKTTQENKATMESKAIESGNTEKLFETPKDPNKHSHSPEIPLQSTVSNEKPNSLHVDVGHVSDTSPLHGGEADELYNGGHLEPLPEPISPIPEDNTHKNPPFASRGIMTALANKSIFTTGSSSEIEVTVTKKKEKPSKAKFVKPHKKSMLANVAEWNIGPPSKKRRLKSTHSNSTMLSFIDEDRPRKRTALKVDVSGITAPRLLDTTTN